MGFLSRLRRRKATAGSELVPPLAPGDLYELTRTDGARFVSGGISVVVRLHDVGALELPAGEIVACDPFTSAGDARAFTRAVPPGAYPVELRVFELPETDDKRVGVALVRLAEGEPERWEPAVTAGQDVSTLKDGETFGYGVDSGTGCFAAPEALAELGAALDDHYRATRSYQDPLMKALEAADEPTWSRAVLDYGSHGNVVAFSTGFGDGFYTTHWGLDARGDAVCLITDFDLVYAADLVVESGDANG